MTSYPELFNELLAPFEPASVKSRKQAGRELRYITARTAMNRLDEAVGPENWWDEYEQSERSVVCKLTLRLPDGKLLTKVDVGGHAGMQDEGDDEKSGFSDAFKRAAAKFGVGRYLYNDGVPALKAKPTTAPQILSFPNTVTLPAADTEDDGVAQADSVDRQQQQRSAPKPPPEHWGNPPANGSQLIELCKQAKEAGHDWVGDFFRQYQEDNDFGPMRDWSGGMLRKAWMAMWREIDARSQRKN